MTLRDKKQNGPQSASEQTSKTYKAKEGSEDSKWIIENRFQNDAVYCTIKGTDQHSNGLIQTSRNINRSRESFIQIPEGHIQAPENTNEMDFSKKKMVRMQLGDSEEDSNSEEEVNEDQNCNKNTQASEDPLNTVTEPLNLGDFSRFGYYTIFIIVLCEMMLLPQMFNLTFMVYGGVAPRPVSCGNVSLRESADEAQACIQLKQLINETRCQPQFEVQFESVAYEFDYYCDRIALVKRSISIQLFGVLLGALAFGQFSDSFGRRRVLFVAHLGMFAFGLAASQLSQSLFQFTVLQFFALFFVGGQNTVMHVFQLENVPKRYRIIIITALSYSPNYVALAGVAYLAQEWRMLLLVNSLLNIPAFLLLILAFESPRWLIQSGRLRRARAALIAIERLNGTDTLSRIKAVDELIDREVKLNETKRRNRKYYLYHIFYTTKMTRYICVICFTLMSTSMLAYALLFNMEHLSGSIYWNSALFGLLRYSMNLTVGSLDYFVPRVGRKTVLNGALGFILVMLATMFVYKLSAWENALVLRVTTICAVAMCSQLFMISAVVSSELFPTAVRNLSSSLGQAWNRIGAIIAPHVFYLALSWAPLPYLLLFVLMGAIMSLFTAFIPETKNSPMVDHMPAKHERVFAPRSLKRRSFLRMDVAPSVARLTSD